jgi:hypothetical protein
MKWFGVLEELTISFRMARGLTTGQAALSRYRICRGIRSFITEGSQLLRELS